MIVGCLGAASHLVLGFTGAIGCLDVFNRLLASGSATVARLCPGVFPVALFVGLDTVVCGRLSRDCDCMAVDLEVALANDLVLMERFCLT